MATAPPPHHLTTSPVGRLAPSPTGAQHVGNARTYLIAWLSARSQGGRVVLRMEDIDSPRVKPGAAEQACADLRWLGLDWDEEPIVQTARLRLYESALRRLQAREMVYPGTCSGRRVADAPDEQPYAWRFRVTAESPPFRDGFRGPTRVNLREVGG